MPKRFRLGGYVITKDAVNVYFSNYFGLSIEDLETFGALDISLINDLPLFIDPFLLFNSSKKEYRFLHDNMIKYLRFLRDTSTSGLLGVGELRAWFTFSEVKQNWLGFSEVGNRGSGLGLDFARALNNNLNKIFANFGDEQITKSSHLEKLCLIGSGVGRDNISDFTTNLIKEYLLDYTQNFARKYLAKKQRKLIPVAKVKFNYATETWESGEYELPYIFNDFVLLTPIDILTKDEIWINRSDMARDYQKVLNAVSDDQLRAQLSNYIFKALKSLPKNATQKDMDDRIFLVYGEFPEMIDYFIKSKEDSGDEAVKQSAKIVEESKRFYIIQVNRFVEELNQVTGFYQLTGDTYIESQERVKFLKDFVENKGGHRIFYKNGKPIRSEADLHLLYRLTWYGSPSDVSREVNDGRGPADFKISRGAFDKTIVEFKLASNTQLERNLQKQVEIYQKASDAPRAIKVIVYFTRQELGKINRILKKLNLTDNVDIVLIDARNDNKPSGSKASPSYSGKSSEINFDFGEITFDSWDLNDLNFDGLNFEK